jgi:hypothetical protein
MVSAASIHAPLRPPRSFCSQPWPVAPALIDRIRGGWNEGRIVNAERERNLVRESHFARRTEDNPLPTRRSRPDRRAHRTFRRWQIPLRTMHYFREYRCSISLVLIEMRGHSRTLFCDADSIGLKIARRDCCEAFVPNGPANSSADAQKPRRQARPLCNP